ncbi:MAD-domain-containing protein [Mycena floridula]|nr:MAD-domain-containing protein [Mycena floridula]
MNGDSLLSSSMSRASSKRDSLAAELERDPQLSAAKRHQRSQIFNSTVSHASLERQLTTATAAKLDLQTKLREKDIQIERLESDRRWLSERETEEKEEKERERAMYNEEKKKTDAELKSLRSSLSSLREEHADLQDQHAALSRSTTQTLASQKTQINMLTRKAELAEDELAQTKALAEERLTSLHELQERLDDLETAQDNFMRKGADEENMAVVRDELHRQANYLRTLESTNNKLSAELVLLRERHVSLEVLREEKRGLETKLRGMEEMRERLVKLQAQVDAGRQEREDWANKSMENTSTSSTPISVTQNLSELRLTHARLLEEHGATVALLRTREAELGDAERRITELQATVQTLEDQAKVLKGVSTRKEHQTDLAERESKFGEALIASFLVEAAAQDGARIDEMLKQRIADLETLLAEHKAMNTKLIKDLDQKEFAALDARSSTALVEQERKANEALQTVLEEHKTTLAEHKIALEKVEELEQTLFELSGEIAGGRHVPPGVRILSMKDNPEQQWFDLRQAAMDRLREENTALLVRLKELEDNGASSSLQRNASSSPNDEQLVPRASWELVNEEKLELEDALKQKEKRLLRLQQIFQSKSAEFREAIAAILGVKLAFYPNGQVRVTSMFDLQASFVFQPDKPGEGTTMQLIAQGEGGPQDLPQMMQYWIGKEQCLPGFLASVTLECYEKSKKEQA